MTGTSGASRGAVRWLTAQSLVFGAMAALLGIVANAMFLEAYGSAWLPATYIAIGVAGIVVSGAIARSAQRFDLLGIALGTLTAAALGIGLSWLIATGGDAAWVSVPLLVLFPILIQLGFVFIGGQAGRLLDIAGIKAGFPRIMSGFPIGAVIGGVMGGQLVAWLGRTEDLLLATAIAQAAFAALLWGTSRRHPFNLAVPATAPDARSDGDRERQSRQSLRRLLASRFVLLIVGYQVLSALGSQLADYLVFDRATAQYPDAESLAGFIAGYTAIMNAASIAFLLVVAGPLLRRFGLRLGIASNPLVLTAFAIAMIAVLATTGGASMALLLTVSAARIADIALTDGTTRTSINAMYQVLPDRARLSVQTSVEGIGVPVAIGISGVLILVLNALPFALAATIGVTAVVCAVWTWVGIVLYGAYGPALVHALRRRPLLADTADLGATAGDELVARQLLSSGDARATRLGLDLLTTMSSQAVATELAALVDDPRPEVRMTALGGLAASGDDRARRRLADEVRVGIGAADPGTRLRAAFALGALDADDRAAARPLLVDPDEGVRCAALDSVQAGDGFAVDDVIEALGDPATLGAAAGAVTRLGDAVVPAMDALLGRDGPAPPSVGRLVRAASERSPARDDVLVRHVGHRDRELGLVVTQRLVAPAAASAAAATALDAVLADDVRHAARVLAALGALDPSGGGSRVTDEPVRRALEDELDLVRRRVAAGRRARHGSERLGPALVELEAGGSTGALALEALGVLLDAREASVVLPLLQPDLSIADRHRGLKVSVGTDPTDAAGWLRNMIEDAGGLWRSTWIRACAIHAAAGRGVLDQVDTSAAEAIGDPVIDEELGARPA